MEDIRKVMNSYLKAIGEKERLDEEIKRIDVEIDDAMFNLYHLTDEEVNFIKRETGIIA